MTFDEWWEASQGGRAFASESDALSIARQAWNEALKHQWQPISTMPSGPVMRYHKLWKCPISVRPNSDNTELLRWIEITLSRLWPEEAFEPYWMPMPEPPKNE